MLEFRFLILSVILYILYWIGGVESAAPDMVGLSASATVKESVTILTSLDVFTVTDPDGDSFSCTHDGNAAEFNIERDTIDPSQFTLQLLPNAGLEYDTAQTHTISITCTDTNGEASTASIIVNVEPNQPPTITPPSSPVTVNETETSPRLLYVLTVADTESDAFTCSIASSSPSTNDFEIIYTTDYNVYIKDGATFDASTAPSYTLTLSCSDNWGTSTAILTVSVLADNPPTFQNIPHTETVDASTADIATSVYTVTATDEQGALLTYTMTSDPTTSYFLINSATGVVTTTQHLIYAPAASYDLNVTASNGHSSSSAILRIVLSNRNTAPVIANLDLSSTTSIQKSELLASGTLLYTLVIQDPDAGDTASVTWDVTPTGQDVTFSHNQTTHKLSLAANKSFNYELYPTYEVQFTVTDGIFSSGPYTLDILIEDKNEPCVFDSNTYVITMYEDSKGQGSTDPSIITTDEDGDTTTLSIQPSADGYHDYFAIDGTTGIVTFDVDYDVDTTYAKNTTLIVQCTDPGGETGTATLSINIEDINDNTPEFGSTGYIVYVDQWDEPGRSIDTLSATDIDSGNNADIEYTWTPATSAYFKLSTHGVISLLKDIRSESYGYTERFVVKANDQGTVRRTGTTTVDVIFREATTVTPSTTTTTAASSSKGFFDYPENIIMVAFMVLLGLALLGLIAYLLYRYCRKQPFEKLRCNCKCKRKIKPKKLPEVKNKPPAKPKAFEFWNDDELIGRKTVPFSTQPVANVFPASAPVE